MSRPGMAAATVGCSPTWSRPASTLWCTSQRAARSPSRRSRSPHKPRILIASAHRTSRFSSVIGSSVLTAAAAVAASALAGCYIGGGLGYAGGSAATAHLSAGIAMPLGERGAVRVGGGVAIGRGPGADSATPGPVVLGGAASLAVSGRHAFASVVDLALPIGGSWTSDGKPSHVGRGYAGVGYPSR